MKMNEDSILINNKIYYKSSMNKVKSIYSKSKIQLYLLSDGIGGHKYGEIASSTILNIFKNNREKAINKEGILKIIDIIKQELIILAKNHNYYNIGGTLSGLIIFSDKIFTINVGDSRIYQIRKNKIEQITKDHSYIQELVDKKILNYENMHLHPQKNILTSAIISNDKEIPKIDIKEQKKHIGDKYLICSDGFWEKLDVSSIKEKFNQKQLLRITQQLFKKVILKKPLDNLSIINLQIKK